MDREEAIEKVKAYLTDYLPQEEYDKVEEIIEALQTKTDDDLISRKDALEQIAQAECGLHYEDCEADNCTCNYIWRILNIPSAESKTREWTPNRKDDEA